MDSNSDLSREKIAQLEHILTSNRHSPQELAQFNQALEETPEIARWLVYFRAAAMANVDPALRWDQMLDELEYMLKDGHPNPPRDIMLAHQVMSRPELVWGEAGPLRPVVEQIIQRALPPGERFTYRMRLGTLRRSWGYNESSQEERHLIDSIILCEARLLEVQKGHANCFDGRPKERTATYWDKRLSAAERSLHRAQDQLIKLRKFYGVERVTENRRPPSDPGLSVMLDNLLEEDSPKRAALPAVSHNNGGTGLTHRGRK